MLCKFGGNGLPVKMPDYITPPPKSEQYMTKMKYLQATLITLMNNVMKAPY